MIDYNKLFICDVESTGFKENAIISIAFLSYQDGELIKKENIFVNPEALIEDGAYAIHGISQAQVENCPTFNLIWDRIFPFLANSVFVGHNVQYDEKAIRIAAKRYGLELPEYVTLCTCKNAKKWVKGLENYKLDTLCDYFGVKLDNHHDAFEDTVACLEIYNHLVELSKGALDIKKTGGK